MGDVGDEGGGEVALDDFDVVLDMVYALKSDHTRTAHHTDNAVTLR